jgi:pimeloyl-ACP methyl ester carboxylesterase
VSSPLAYERHGSGEPLLLITGFAISAAVFDPVLDLYASRFDCIRYDNRGSGRSDSPLWPTSMPELAHDAVRLLDALGIPSAHVYGVSMGGMIAQELAIRHPERVRGLVLGATTPGGPRAVRPARAELTALGAAATKALSQPGRPWLGAMLFSPEFRRDQPERTRELLGHFAAHRARPRGIAAHWWASVYHDTVSRLGQIQAPTLVMHGARDAISPVANARLLAERIPGCGARACGRRRSRVCAGAAAGVARADDSLARLARADRHRHSAYRDHGPGRARDPRTRPADRCVADGGQPARDGSGEDQRRERRCGA